MVAIAPGWGFLPDELQLLEYLHDRDRGRTRSSHGAINEGIDPYSRTPDQLPNVKENGSYYYADCLPKKIAGREARKRRTLDGSGYWKSTDGKKPILEEGQIVGYMQKLRFYRGRTSSTKWVMTEYTLHHNTSDDAPKAICVIRNTAWNQRKKINQPLPGSDNGAERSFAGNYRNTSVILMDQAGALDPPPPLESDNMEWLSYFD